MSRFSLTLVAALLFCGAVLRAEEIQLKDGSKLSGKVIAVTDDSFRIKTSYGEVRVERTQIVSINFPENQLNGKSEDDSGPGPMAVDESLEGTSYTNRTAKFQLTVPKGWMTSETMRNQSKDIAAALVSPDQSLFLLVTPEKFSGTMDTYRVLVQTQAQLKFKDYEKLGETETQIDGKAATRIIWHGKNPSANDTPLKAAVYIVPYDGRVVRLTFLTIEGLFDTNLPTFEKIAASYRTTP